VIVEAGKTRARFLTCISHQKKIQRLKTLPPPNPFTYDAVFGTRQLLRWPE
jgi:hypothetical protein